MSVYGTACISLSLSLSFMIPVSMVWGGLSYGYTNIYCMYVFVCVPHLESSKFAATIIIISVSGKIRYGCKATTVVTVVGKKARPDAPRPISVLLEYLRS